MKTKRIHLICSAHHKRGEKVREFNLSPFLYNKTQKKTVRYRDYEVNLISKGWIDVDGVFYLELNTSEGILYITDYTYSLL
jgi:hypothetical protein